MQIGSTLDVSLNATWLICADICVPETGTFDFSIPVVADPQPDATAANVFERARAALPTRLEGEAFFSVHGDSFVLDLPRGSNVESAYFFPAAAGMSEPAADQKLIRKGDRLLITVKGGADLRNVGDRLSGVVAYASAGEEPHYVFEAERRAAPASTTIGRSGAAGQGLIGLLLAAFFGGALLNLMPCVFPILFVDTWSAVWDQADVADIQIAGNDTKLYTNLVLLELNLLIKQLTQLL